MIPEKMREVLKYEGVVSIVSQNEEAHIVNTWNSYLNINEEDNIIIPMGRMFKTEENLKMNNKILLTLGSREVDGFHSKGTGFLIEGTGNILYSGKEYDLMKEKFPWIRAILIIMINNTTQTL